MTDEKKLLEQVTKGIDDMLEAKLSAIVGKEVAMATRAVVEKMKKEKSQWGYDRSLLSDEQKSDFAKFAKEVSMNFVQKANEAIVPQIDSRGGYLLPTEVADGIQRVAYSVGVALSQMTAWPMTSDKLSVPNYSGSILEGEYLGVDVAGSVTAIGFDSANLQTEVWQLAFALDKRILAGASTDVGAWLVALAGEALANKIDKMVFVGTGNPFTGITQHPEVAVFTLETGKNTFAEYAVIDDSIECEAQLEESFLETSAYYFHRTVWAKLRKQKDDTGNYLLGLGAGFNNEAFLMSDPRSAGGPRPVGNILGRPVYTVRHLPAATVVSQASTIFGVFGSLRCMGYGRKNNMTMQRYESGSFGGKEIALANQVGLVMHDEHALAVTLPQGLLNIKTNAS